MSEELDKIFKAFRNPNLKGILSIHTHYNDNDPYMPEEIRHTYHPKAKNSIDNQDNVSAYKIYLLKIGSECKEWIAKQKIKGEVQTLYDILKHLLDSHEMLIPAKTSTKLNPQIVSHTNETFTRIKEYDEKYEYLIWDDPYKKVPDSFYRNNGEIIKYYRALQEELSALIEFTRDTIEDREAEIIDGRITHEFSFKPESFTFKDLDKGANSFINKIFVAFSTELSTDTTTEKFASIFAGKPVSQEDKITWVGYFGDLLTLIKNLPPEIIGTKRSKYIVASNVFRLKDKGDFTPDELRKATETKNKAKIKKFLNELLPNGLTRP